MNVSTALNKKYIPYTIVMLTSLCENNPCHVDAYLLSAELEKSDYDKISRALEDYDIDIHPLRVDRELFTDKMPRDLKWTVEMYFRLLLWDMLPEDVNRILYLDVDIIVNRDIQEMYAQDFEGAELVVCQDNCGIKTNDPRSETQCRMFADMDKAGGIYFNSGVMLANVEALRGNYPFSVYVDAMEAWGYEMKAPDQDILNYVHWKKLKYQDPLKYNCYSHYLRIMKVPVEEVDKTTSIVHFIANKPWSAKDTHYSIEQIWWRYAKKTKIYHEILEIFLDNTMSDFSLYDKVDFLINERARLTDENERLKSAYEQSQSAVNELSEINRQLIDYLDKLTGNAN